MNKIFFVKQAPSIYEVIEAKDQMISEELSGHKLTSQAKINSDGNS
jgi:hypothetical protein